jgi:hypothetical protein
VALGMLGACSAAQPETAVDSDSAQHEATDDDASGDSSDADDPPGDETDGADGDAGSSGCDPLDTDALVDGKVLAPNLEIPISGALVYLTRGEVAPIADGTYCSECVQLSCDEPFTLTRPDGTFELAALAGSGQKLVVQKGEFRRVVELDVHAGSQSLSVDHTNLPGRWDPDAGMWIPRIAVYETNPDAVFNVLAKFGLADVDDFGWYVTGSEQFTRIQDDDGALLEDFEAMSRYHIIFVPCASTKYWSGAPAVPTQRVDNVRKFVAAGGKWYATDHSNEYIEEPFPAYQDFHTSVEYGPDIQPAYTSTGKVVDDGLLDWLMALPDSVKESTGMNELGALPAITTYFNYSGIDAIHPVMAEAADGEQVDVGHHAYVEGACLSCSDATTTRPMAVSGQYGCGRMMYSTFETSPMGHAGLTPQELVLLYMILEISVCHQEEPPPPPPL